jgi:hypothetical protein
MSLPHFCFALDDLNLKRVVQQLALETLINRAHISLVVFSKNSNSSFISLKKHNVAVVHCATNYDFEKFTDKRQIDILFDCFSIGKLHEEVIAVVKERQIKLGKILSGQLPSLKPMQLAKYWSTHSKKKLIFSGLRFFLRKLRRQNPPDYYDLMLVSGSYGIKSIGTNVARVPIAIEDYYQYVQKSKQKETRRQDKDYLLFLDDCIVDGRDMTVVGLPPPMDKGLYYEVLGKTFEAIEALTNKKIIIAGHPDGKRIPDYKKLFGCRSVIFGKTAELTRSAHFVMTHGSTSVSFAVLWQVPTLILNHRDLAKSFRGPQIMAMSMALGAPNVWMDNLTETLEDTLSKLTVNNLNYGHYMDSYICTSAGHAPNRWDALFTFLVSDDYLASKKTDRII